MLVNIAPGDDYPIRRTTLSDRWIDSYRHFPRGLLQHYLWLLKVKAAHMSIIGNQSEIYFPR